MNHKRAVFIMILTGLSIMSCAPLSQVELTSNPSAQMWALVAPPTPIFNQCDPDQITILERALQDAQILALNALQNLKSVPESSRDSSNRYLEWFGAYEPYNYKLVTDNFQHIYTALATQTITFSCTCSDTKLAYIHADQPYEITLCRSYWTAPANGTDSQAGVLVHEISHFTEVASTQDVTYGQTLARMTAKYIPAKAIQNADSYVYFAENNPPLP